MPRYRLSSRSLLSLPLFHAITPAMYSTLSLLSRFAMPESDSPSVYSLYIRDNILLSCGCKIKFNLRQGCGKLAFRIDDNIVCYRVKARYNQSAVPDNRLAGFVKLAVKSVGIPVLAKLCNRAVGQNCNNRIRAKIRYTVLLCGNIFHLHSQPNLSVRLHTPANG